MTTHEPDTRPAPQTMTLAELRRRNTPLAATPIGPDDCNGYCLRSSDHGVPVPGDPVSHAHPDCAVHGEALPFGPGDGSDSAGRPICDRCRAYEGEHAGGTYLTAAGTPRTAR